MSVRPREVGGASCACSSDGLDEGVAWQSGVAIAFCSCFFKAIRQGLVSLIEFYWGAIFFRLELAKPLEIGLPPLNSSRPIPKHCADHR